MTLTANQNGDVAGVFTVPASIPAGSKLVEFFGDATSASATFIGRGVLQVNELRTITTTYNRRQLTWHGDPLAQTFVVTAEKQIAAVDLWFTAVGTSKVLVQIRDVSLGFPTKDVVAESVLPPSAIRLNDFTRFRFPPVPLAAGREYAIVAMCDDSVSALAVGELGKYDPSLQRWVTSQPYTVGVLLSSSNNSTWTAHQDKDLAFRLIAADYNVITNSHTEGSTRKTVALAPVTVTQADHLMVLAAVERPTADTDVVFDLTVDGLTYSVTEGQVITLPQQFTGPVAMAARLIGTYESSPRLYPDVHLVASKRLSTSDYISRAIQADGGTKIDVYYDALTPGTSSVNAQAENGTGTWTAMPVVEGTQIGDGWIEVHRRLTGFNKTETRVKLILAGSAMARPRVRNLRVSIT